MRFDRYIPTGALALILACDAAPTAPPAATGVAPPPAASASVLPIPDDRTPLQQSVLQAVGQRQALGLPVPRVALTYREDTAAAPRAPLLRAAGPALPARTVTATTVIEFDHPVQAGHEEWPAMVVQGEVPEGVTGYVREGDYTDVIKQAIADAEPNAWTNVEYETGPRTYTVTESIVTASSAESQPQVVERFEDLAALTVADELLLGFTILGPNIDYSVSWDLSICIIWFFGCHVEWEIFDFWAGFKLDWTIGIRLPMAMNVTADDPVLEGATFQPVSAATGEDWNAARFEAAGVTPADGNEFLLEFILKAGVFVEISYIDVVDLGVDIDVSEGASFTTPLGAGQTITLPSLYFPVWGLDLAVVELSLGVSLTPNAGSDRYTAGWTASAEGSGSGTVTYTEAGEDVALGTVTAVDGPGNAALELSDFRYYFTEFVLDLGAYIYLEVIGYDNTWVIPVTDFDLGGATGSLYVGPHPGTLDVLNLLIPIQNVAPTAEVALSGATLVNGTPTFLARTGQPLTFTGHGTDPGRDNLTLSWDWDDGAPAPDVSTTYPVPYDVTEDQTHAFADACLYQARLTVADDDGAVSVDEVPVLVAGDAANAGRLEGYWQHQLGRRGATDFDDAALDCYLSIVAHMSTVFSEARGVTSIAAAHGVLTMQANRGNPREQFDRELLVVWLNFAHGALDYTDFVDTDGDGLLDTPFADALASAEAGRLNPVTSDKEIRRLTQMLHQISVATVT